MSASIEFSIFHVQCKYVLLCHWDHFCSSLYHLLKPDSTITFPTLLYNLSSGQYNSIQSIGRQENTRKFQTKQKYLFFCVHFPPPLCKNALIVVPTHFLFPGNTSFLSTYKPQPQDMLSVTDRDGQLWICSQSRHGSQTGRLGGYLVWDRQISG